MMTSDIKTKDWAKQLISLFPELDKQKQQISLGIYRLLSEGTPVSIDRLSSSLGLRESTVRETLEGWPAVYYDDEKRIIGYWGLTLKKMGHLLEVEGKRLYTWCAWDTLFIPSLLGKTANIESKCPVTGEVIKLKVGPRGFESLSNPNSRMSILVPKEIGDNVISSFCHYVYFFSSPDAASTWTSKHEDTFVISLDEAFKLARMKNEAQYSDVLIKAA